MLATTDAIVLSLQPYSDKAHILHAYTRANGRINYMVYGLGRKHAFGLYAPLSLIRVTANYPASGMPTVSETTPASHCNSQLLISPDPYKRTIVLFISEVLFHVLRMPMQDEPMFDFIRDSIIQLDTRPYSSNFHLTFLVGLAAKLGFALDNTFHTPLADGENALPLSRKERQDALMALCDYFAEHVETWQTPKSLAVLTEVFD